MEISDLGSWNLDIHHRYNFHQGILQKGDGSSVYYKYQSRVAATLIGSSDKSKRSFNCLPDECNGPASSGKLLSPITLTSGADGSLYIGDGNLIRRITPQGYVYTVFKMTPVEMSKSVRMINQHQLQQQQQQQQSTMKSSMPMSLPLLLPSGSKSNSLNMSNNGLGDTFSSSSMSSGASSSSSGSSSSYANNYHIKLSPLDHHLYISDAERHQILRIQTIDKINDPESNYDVFIGNGERCLPKDINECGDGSSAIDAKLTFPKGIAFTFDGSIYFADGNSIRMVNKKGIIQTVIGNNNGNKKYGNNYKQQWKPIPCTGSIELSSVTLRWPSELAVHPIDGSIYFLDDSMVLKILPDSRLMVAAGLPAHCRSNTGAATTSSLSSSSTGNSKSVSSTRNGKKGKSDRNNRQQQQQSSPNNHNSDNNEYDDLIDDETNDRSKRKSWRDSNSRNKNIDIGLVVSFAFSSNGDLFVGTVDLHGIHRIYLLREKRSSITTSSLVKQEVVHFFGSNKGSLPVLTSMAICEVETCRDIDAHNCSCALASREMISSFGVSI